MATRTHGGRNGAAPPTDAGGAATGGAAQRGTGGGIANTSQLFGAVVNALDGVLVGRMPVKVARAAFAGADSLSLIARNADDLDAMFAREDVAPAQDGRRRLYDAMIARLEAERDQG